jgi:hypothetical protein
VIAWSLVLWLALLAQEPQGRDAAAGTTGERGDAGDAVTAAIDRGLEFLVKAQERDGSWGKPRSVMNFETFATIGTYEAWTVGTTGLVCMALMDSATTPAQLAALDRGLDFLLDRVFVKRVSDWDTDNVWGYIYGLHAFVRALAEPRFEKDPRREQMRAMAVALVEHLRRWQTPSGGWAYYDTDVTSIPPVWATSFTTAAAVVAMQDARAVGIEVPSAMLDKAVTAIERSRLKNGAFSYSLDTIPNPSRLESIDQVKGSLCRIQVCQLALYRAGRASVEQLEAGLDVFFHDHRFLDVARKKPIPHEAYYQNSGYFYLFGHFYAAMVLDQLPAASRARFAPKLQQEILKTQESDGSMWDFYISGYGRTYGTAFGVLGLKRSLKVD